MDSARAPRATPTRTWRRWALELGTEDIVRAEGADPELLTARRSPALEVASEALAFGGLLLAPAVAWRRLNVVSSRHDALRVGPRGAQLFGVGLSERLLPACEVCALVCTIGPYVEDAASALFKADPALALALDAFGSAAVDRLTFLARSRVEAQAALRGWLASAPLSPGGAGWPADVGQPQIFSLVKASSIGVSLTAFNMMRPRKSTSFVIGLGPDAKTAGWGPCEACELAASCRYREAREQLYDAQRAGPLSGASPLPRP
ncbi:MAG TPA: hypothetical protein VK425_12115 [Acidimicrobiales bacterium]|nr:hypothetical protein [Acidimicrobiales bacterium]